MIRVATANRCPPRTLLQLLGRVHHRFRPDRWVELRPQSTITLNTAALHRLAAYSAIPAAHLLRALPELGHEHSNGEPIVRVSPPQRAFLRSCPDCECRAGGAALTPDRHRLQLVCARHGTWLVNADPPLDIAPVPRSVKGRENIAPPTTPASRRRHQHALSGRTRMPHQRLARAWLAHPPRETVGGAAADPPARYARKDRYLLARTEHWSMLPEAVAVITVLANDITTPPHQMTSQRHLTRSLSRALHLDSYWSTGTGELFDPHHILMPLPQQTVERARPARSPATHTGQRNRAQRVAPRD